MDQRAAKIKRIQEISFIPNPVHGSAAVFFWGPRQTGKTTYLHDRFPQARFFDLLDTALAAELSVQPHRLREWVLAERPELVVIDEVQKVPAVLPEVHWLLENTACKLVLCGSSARRLRREAQNLLGGRAAEVHLLPLVSAELPDIDLDRALNHGLLPAHYLLEEPRPLLRAYVHAYLKEEILDESLTRNVPAFSRFLQVVGLTHGRQLNYANVARECGVAASTVRSYFQILQDTLLGFELPAWRQVVKRRLTETAKFYLFDVGVANSLNPELREVREGSDVYGRAFEHLLINEVRAYLAYHRLDWPLCYWRTSAGLEVDLVAGAMEVALEFKASRDVRREEMKGLLALREEHPRGRSILVSREARPRTAGAIEIMPWHDFCRRLWAGEILR
jgi:predicted AAA+ superfamily ATPase